MLWKFFFGHDTPENNAESQKLAPVVSKCSPPRSSLKLPGDTASTRLPSAQPASANESTRPSLGKMGSLVRVERLLRLVTPPNGAFPPPTPPPWESVPSKPWWQLSVLSRGASQPVRNTSRTRPAAAHGRHCRANPDLRRCLLENSPFFDVVWSQCCHRSLQTNHLRVGFRNRNVWWAAGHISGDPLRLGLLQNTLETRSGIWMFLPQHLQRGLDPPNLRLHWIALQCGLLGGFLPRLWHGWLTAHRNLLSTRTWPLHGSWARSANDRYPTIGHIHLRPSLADHRNPSY